MDDQARRVIDDQFDRAVEIVQGLPKSGPVQTGYEEKLAMYSLYKQATVGNVKGPRPALWDMLGRAKWDAWAKQKDVDPYQAKMAYVFELLKVLRKPEYDNQPIAQGFVAELESFNTMPTGTPRDDDDDGSSSSSESEAEQQRKLSQSFQNMQRRQMQARQIANPEDADDDDESSSDTDDDRDQVPEGFPQRNMHLAQSQNTSALGRPPSSMSSHRYQTPLGGSMIMSPPLPSGSGQARQRPQTMFIHPQSVQHLGVGGYGLPRPESDPTMSAHMSRPLPSTSQSLLPESQPMPIYETPSAFAASGATQVSGTTASSPHLVPVSGAASSSSTGNFGVISVPGSNSTTLLHHHYPANMYPGHPGHRAADPASRGSHIDLTTPGLAADPLSSFGGSGMRSAVERAVESVQAHLAALQERMEALETRTLVLSRSGQGSPYQGLGHSGQHTGGSPLASPYTSRMLLSDGTMRVARWWDFDEEYFDWEHMGLWSVVLAPLARMTKFLSSILGFLLARREREGLTRLSPGLIVLRRLLLDASFVLGLLFIGRRLWKRSGMRRQEVLKALRGVWTAITGSSAVGPARILIDKAV
ncbi:ACBP-domain-containing protein [Schizopora paradoxa]|uniref:ACBP-domain-containing protein n=1 Tax=Schizopora paradoxa TaxID=27342 RepID=A0A0H2SF80_9AGAM|nr:ACBP-domain-containing protein [Schizopora paradoxa]